jgi:hypothetical protein
MANGKPGDHPYTDIVHLGRDTYSARAANLVREIAALADERTRRELAELLLRDYNLHQAPDVTRLERVLSERRDRVRSEAIARGYEVPAEPLSRPPDPA